MLCNFCGDNNFLFRSDYLLITNDLNESFGVYCSTKSGTVVYVTGDRVMLRFHTNHIVQRKGFLIFFNAVPPGNYFRTFINRSARVVFIGQNWLVRPIGFIKGISGFELLLILLKVTSKS